MSDTIDVQAKTVAYRLRQPHSEYVAEAGADLLEELAAALAQMTAERYPLPLNEMQERVIREWAADDRLWTTQETVEINLRTFARVVLKEAVSVPQDGLKSLVETWTARAIEHREENKRIFSVIHHLEPAQHRNEGAARAIGKCCDELKAFLAVSVPQDDIERLKSELRAWEEREAAICPEDVGFEEYIGILQQKLKEAVPQDDTHDRAQPSKCGGRSCNPYVAKCGAQFCTFDEMCEHDVTFHGPPSVVPAGAGEGKK